MEQRRLSAAPRRAAVYARTATAQPRDGSIEDQVRMCQALAERERWVIVETFSDHGVSGSTVLRPGYQALMSAMRSGAVDVVLAERFDRFSRNPGHLAALHQAAESAGVQIITLSEGEITEATIGLEATLEALYLKELADKRRRRRV
ncbi:recombinase family protein [Roseococcus sp. SDR]|uniref:recombinase family protein n=1 Tax=Roseococcus sp. SDR TaxID=2835532 RepID=UPI001BCF3590|nr:recombinase family protein [Roseococcus sp. SDR]MBS7793175.1 recombinase family protein [Roseococcus sp. SDR]MBV1848489.1 recombinase family protein [Roseococcus sp. SDR]